MFDKYISLLYKNNLVTKLNPLSIKYYAWDDECGSAKKKKNFPSVLINRV